MTLPTLNKIAALYVVALIICALYSCELPIKNFHHTEFYKSKINLQVPDYLVVADTINDTGEHKVSYIFKPQDDSDKDVRDTLHIKTTIFNDDSSKGPAWEVITTLKKLMADSTPDVRILKADSDVIHGHRFAYIETITPIVESKYSYHFLAISFINNKEFDFSGYYYGYNYKKYSPDFYKSLKSIKISSSY